MWEVERSEFWANLSGYGGSKSIHVGTANLPVKPKAGEIRRELNKLFADHGFRVTDLNLSMRSFGIITGDLERTEPETRVLDVFNADSFSMTWIPGTVEENLKRSKLWRNQIAKSSGNAKGPVPELSLPETEPERKPVCYATYRNGK